MKEIVVNKIIVLIIIFIISLSIINTSNALENNILPINTKKDCTIINVDDWDTFDLKCNNGDIDEYIYNVRTLWVNAPDIGNNWNNHCFYDDARRIIQLIKIKKIKLNIEFYWSDLCKDPYKWCRNLVRIIDKLTNKDINEQLIIKWYNFSWTNFSMVPQKFKIKYFIAEKIAQKNKSWLWGKCSISYNEEYNYLNSAKPFKMTN